MARKHYAELEIENIMEVNTKKLDSMFSRLTLLFLNKVKDAKSLDDLKALRRAYKVCAEMKCLDHEVIDSINKQIIELEEKWMKK
mgnify:FL=1